MTTTGRDRYHHGDLRNALARAATELAASGGPDAVTIRGAAREVGVTPTAAYRHFGNQTDLLEAARSLAMDGMVAAMAEFLQAVPEGGDPVERALQRLLSTGRGYIRFAMQEPGIFQTCFTGRLRYPTEPMPADAAPYALLGEMLDELVQVGYLAPEDRPGAEAGPWAAVHGLALLLTDGPLKDLPAAEREAAIDRTLQMTARGLATGPKAVAAR
ncbi:TetR family transcriptional regulator [Nocardioides sp. J9]|uniref:TetR/AcrR family transcriptional regulator n=1 Tax=unclassified Nocardioides TaxID=2615069 RepID=UPI00048C9B80|nr:MULTISPECIES: TetR/AcrR family transcriptional regulator [unclassified Nocardioides]TWH01876.1 TetR family transcriptional regulator [Nocardioides sp. J9]